PVFSNLPPEKLKGQIRPMSPSNIAEVSGTETPLEMPAPTAVETIEAALPVVLPATPGKGLELVPTPKTEQEPKSAGRTTRSRTKRERQPATFEAGLVETESAAAPTQAPEVEAAEKPSRGRPRRKG